MLGEWLAATWVSRTATPTSPPISPVSRSGLLSFIFLFPVRVSSNGNGGARWVSQSASVCVMGAASIEQTRGRCPQPPPPLPASGLLKAPLALGHVDERVRLRPYPRRLHRPRTDLLGMISQLKFLITSSLLIDLRVVFLGCILRRRPTIPNNSRPTRTLNTL